MGLTEQAKGKRRVIYLTRSDVSWYSRNANAYQKPWMLSRVFDLTVIQPEGVTLPAEIAGNCRLERISCGDVSRRWSLGQMIRFLAGCLGRVANLRRQSRSSSELRCAQPVCLTVATGFDAPCLLAGWWLRRRRGWKWFVFCWDPPALTWRDRTDIRSRLVVACAELIFRVTVRHADRLVLNIHSGLLDEIGFRPQGAQLIPMFNGAVPRQECAESADGPGDPWCIGVLAQATREKGYDLVLDAFALLAKNRPLLRFIWIGEVGKEQRAWAVSRLGRAGISSERFVLAGRLEQAEAFRRLSDCGILLHPYLAVPSLKWNYPLKVVEYMSAGRAIVAADSPGVRAYIADGENGLLFRAGDPEELAKALGKILGDGRGQARFGERAKQDAKKFEWPNLNRELAVKLYEE